MKCLLLFCLLASCTHEKQVDESSSQGEADKVAALRAKAVVVEGEAMQARDPATGWPDPDDGDGLLWAGLLCAAGTPGVQIELGFLAAGVPGRTAHGDCRERDANGDGRPDCSSSTSRDMTLGAMWCLWRTGRLELAQALGAACEARPVLGELACVLGEPYPGDGRVVMTPNMTSLIGKLIFALSSGADDRSYRGNPTHYEVGDDYEAHLAALAIALHGELAPEDLPRPAAGLGDGVFLMTDISQNMLEVLQGLVAANSKDWSAQAALAVYTGAYDPALELLLDDGAPCPSYARGPALACKVSWLWAARLVLRHHPQEAS